MIIGLTTTNVTQYLDCILLKVTRCFLLPSFKINKSSFQSAISVINLTLFQWGCNPILTRICFSSQILITLKDNFFHRNAKVTKLKHNLPCEKIVLMTSHIIWCHKIFSKYNCFMKARIDNCADIIKIAITLIKTTLKNLITVKKNHKSLLKQNFYQYSSI